MSQSSPVLSLPYIQPSQAQKHVTHNDALRVLDAIVQLAVVDWTQASPPASPDTGARYIVGTGGQGNWTGHDAKVAVASVDGWVFVSPLEGWTAQVVGSGAQLTFDGVAWQEVGFDNLLGVGVNAQSDAMNRLSVSADATLLNHEGAGHQLKLNKANVADTASLLFQTSWSGRAEMGTAGTDDFSIKVSADGGTWLDALVIDGATGQVSLPQTASRRVLDGPTVVYVDPVLGSDTATGEAAGASAFATLARAQMEVYRFDAAGHTVTIQLSDGTHTLPAKLLFDRVVPGAAEIVLRGNPAAPASVVVTAAEEVIEITMGRIALEGIKLENSSTGAATLTVFDQGYATVSAVDFGTAGAHILVNKGSLSILGDYTISGAAKFHIRVKFGGYAENFGHTATLTGVFDFSSGFVLSTHLSSIKMSGAAFVGTATGKRFRALYNAIVDTSNGGVDFFPGDEAGDTTDGGIFR